MPFGKGRRKLFRALGFLLIGLATLVVLLPIWFPLALKPLAAKVGAHFSSYERDGYARFSLHSLDLTNDSIILHAHQVDALIPSVWLWKLASGRDSGSKPFLQVENWVCELRPSGESNRSPPFDQVQDAARTLGTIGQWLPQAVFSQGAVRSGKTVLPIPEVSWSEGHIQAKIQLPPKASGQILDVRLTPARPFDLLINSPALHLESKVALSTNLSGFDLQCSTLWQSNRLEGQAHFGRAAVLPDKATLNASDFRISGDLVKLTPYKELAGSLSAEWDRGRFSVDLSAAAHPAPSQTNLPPVDISLKAQGDTNSATVEKLALNLPFAEATLSNSASLTFVAPYLRGPANFDLKADL